mmetsp:Transcript_18501/g.57808  ORF Transcript_18501/g.57808 Transcript_18501/m.57808 type:complete len:141 (+) Transcript_18501:412-834(+)
MVEDEFYVHGRQSTTGSRRCKSDDIYTEMLSLLESPSERGKKTGEKKVDQAIAPRPIAPRPVTLLVQNGTHFCKGPFDSAPRCCTALESELESKRSSLGKELFVSFKSIFLAVVTIGTSRYSHNRRIHTSTRVQGAGHCG